MASKAACVTELVLTCLPCSRTSRKFQALYPEFKHACEFFAEATGWVGWFPVGGLNAEGQIKIERYVCERCLPSQMHV